MSCNTFSARQIQEKKKKKLTLSKPGRDIEQKEFLYTYILLWECTLGANIISS